MSHVTVDPITLSVGGATICCLLGMSSRASVVLHLRRNLKEAHTSIRHVFEGINSGKALGKTKTCSSQGVSLCSSADTLPEVWLTATHVANMIARKATAVIISKSSGKTLIATSTYASALRLVLNKAISSLTV